MQVIYEELSPHRNLQALVEEQEGAVYFYLWAGDDSSFGMRSCWVRNLIAAPEELDLNAVQEGRAPLLPREFCRHENGGAALDKDSLRVVFFEEGDAAALLESDSVLAVIPAWSGIDGFFGYARDCKGDSPLASELDENNPLLLRVRESDAFWLSWQEQGNQTWSKVQSGQINAYEHLFGRHQKYYAIDGGLWPPKALLQLETPDSLLLCTIGMSVRPQPRIEVDMGPDSPFRRIELGISLACTADDSRIIDFARFISMVSASPWQDLSWLGPGHTVACDFIEGYSAVLLLPEPDGAPQIDLPDYDGEPVQMLWMLPITEPELELAINEGSSSLIEQLRAERPSFWTFGMR